MGFGFAVAGWQPAQILHKFGSGQNWKQIYWLRLWQDHTSSCQVSFLVNGKNVISLKWKENEAIQSNWTLSFGNIKDRALKHRNRSLPSIPIITTSTSLSSSSQLLCKKSHLVEYFHRFAVRRKRRTKGQRGKIEQNVEISAPPPFTTILRYLYLHHLSCCARSHTWLNIFTGLQ